MQAEYDALINKGTWEPVVRTKDHKVIGSKWTYKIKQDANGDITKFKSRLCARGDQQTDSTYSEIFSPVIAFTVLRVLLALACQFDLEMHQMDVSNAYLNSDIGDEEVYMRQPKGFEKTGPNGEELVLRLRKSLYGLKQAGRLWGDLLANYLTKQLGFTRCSTDFCVYVYRKNGALVIVGTYVDDLIILSNNKTALTNFKAAISKHFKMTDEGELRWILGMRVTRDRKNRTLKLDQERYVQDLIDGFKMTDCKLATTPAIPGEVLPKIHQGEKYPGLNDPADKTLYRTMVGKLVYAIVGTRPDIAFAVSQVARHFENPTVSHLSAVKRIIRYLKGTISKGLLFDATTDITELMCYCDSDWGSCPDTRRSTSGFIIKLCGAAISWISKRQPTVALSSAETEYMTAAIAASEVIYIRQIPGDRPHQKNWTNNHFLRLTIRDAHDQESYIWQSKTHRHQVPLRQRRRNN